MQQDYFNILEKVEIHYLIILSSACWLLSYQHEIVLEIVQFLASKCDICQNDRSYKYFHWTWLLNWDNFQPRILTNQKPKIWLFSDFEQLVYDC